VDENKTIEINPCCLIGWRYGCPTWLGIGGLLFIPVPKQTITVHSHRDCGWTYKEYVLDTHNLKVQVTGLLVEIFIDEFYDGDYSQNYGCWRVIEHLRIGGNRHFRYECGKKFPI